MGRRLRHTALAGLGIAALMMIFPPVVLGPASISVGYKFFLSLGPVERVDIGRLAIQLGLLALVAAAVAVLARQGR